MLVAASSNLLFGTFGFTLRNLSILVVLVEDVSARRALHDGKFQFNSVAGFDLHYNSHSSSSIMMGIRMPALSAVSSNKDPDSSNMIVLSSFLDQIQHHH